MLDRTTIDSPSVSRSEKTTGKVRVIGVPVRERTSSDLRNSPTFPGVIAMLKPVTKISADSRGLSPPTPTRSR